MKIRANFKILESNTNLKQRSRLNTKKDLIKNHYKIKTNSPHVAKLYETKSKSSYIALEEVPGTCPSQIAKMLQPTSSHDLVNSQFQIQLLSPHCCSLLFGKEQNSTMMNIKNVTDHLIKNTYDRHGLDPCKIINTKNNNTEYAKVIYEFYKNDDDRSKSILLNNHKYLEVIPTKTYIKGQKLIVKDFTIFRSKDDRIKKLVIGKSNDDNGYNTINKVEINKIIKYCSKVKIKETELFTKGEYKNKPKYIKEMAEYLIQYADIGGMITQNPMNTSSDKNMIHFQYIPSNSNLPFVNYSISKGGKDFTWQNLKTQSKIIKNDINLLTKIEKIRLTEQDYPIMIKLNVNGDILLNIVRIKSTNELDKKAIDVMPGWLEICGVFIEGTNKANAFKKDSAYYKIYA
ncbi:hypothetical protein [Aliivibrio sp. S10_S31]|uniref:hypothetical protein n=1 Tax=Aliivibrio sp. S10_S31 TaxID=2720224 RepID=UPI00168077B4|nr:hypothetical protein [Aliivibrio sp. S10_S31]MBD1569747.1 hypothetical protein [Aliivibrio sp. S10_S31]